MKRALALLALLPLAACGSSGDTAATSATPSVAPSTSVAVTPSPGDRLACLRYSEARTEAGRILDALLSPSNAPIGRDALTTALLERQAEAMESAAVSATAPALVSDMRASGLALRQLQYAEQRPETRSVQAFDLVAGRVLTGCRDA